MKLRQFSTIPLTLIPIYMTYMHSLFEDRGAILVMDLRFMKGNYVAYLTYYMPLQKKKMKKKTY